MPSAVEDMRQQSQPGVLAVVSLGVSKGLMGHRAEAGSPPSSGLQPWLTMRVEGGKASFARLSWRAGGQAGGPAQPSFSSENWSMSQCPQLGRGGDEADTETTESADGPQWGSHGIGDGKTEARREKLTFPEALSLLLAWWGGVVRPGRSAQVPAAPAWPSAVRGGVARGLLVSLDQIGLSMAVVV